MGETNPQNKKNERRQRFELPERNNPNADSLLLPARGENATGFTSKIF